MATQTSSDLATAAWAAAEFGAADFGDVRRTRRLVAMAATVARHPAGTVTAAFDDDAAGLQGAYDWLENPATSRRALGRAQRRAAAARCADDDFAFVPVDGSDVTVPDAAGVKGTGPTGVRAHATRGFEVVSALAVRPNGVTVGLCGQLFWARDDAGVSRDRHARPLAEKESWYLHAVVAQAEAAFAAAAPGTRPWFQVDRAGDAVDLLLAAVRDDRLLTVRAHHDRRVVSCDGARLAHLAATAPVLVAYDVAVPARDGAPARVAHVAVRAAPVTLQLHERLEGRTWAVDVSTVWVTEVAPPPGVTPLCWTLHTTYPVANADDALLVVWGYCQRWRVEDFHRTWKSGGCRVEETQLRSAAAVWKWSGLLASVATRLMQLRDVARATPAAPARVAFSDAELEAIVALRAPRDHVPGQMPTVGRVVRWVAELGGYTGKSSGGPPGVTVLQRGMDRVDAVVIALANLKKQRRDQ